MKNVKTILIVLITTMLSVCFILQPTLTYARDAGTIPGEYKNELKQQYKNGSFNPNAYAPDSTSDVTGGGELLKVINSILGWVNLFATISAVICIGIIGIKYMLGSVEERAEYKKSMKPYVIGCVLIFSITTFLKIIASIVETLN